MRKGVVLYVNIIESLYPRILCLKFGLNWPSGSEKEYLWISPKYFHYFIISLLSSLGKGRGPSFEQTWISFTQGCFVPSLVEIGPVLLEKMKMWKVYRRTDRQQKIRKAHFSFQLTWVKIMPHDHKLRTFSSQISNWYTVTFEVDSIINQNFNTSCVWISLLFIIYEVSSENWDI